MIDIGPRSTQTIEIDTDAATAADATAELITAAAPGARGAWFLAEPRDSALRAARTTVTTVAVDGGVDVTVTAESLVRDIALLVDKVDPASQVPNDWNLIGAPSGHAQFRHYEEMFRSCRDRDWVRGLMLWDWPAALYPPEAAAENDDYCPERKPAASYMTTQYATWKGEAR
ncbi:glycoside hydrolase family 113 [Microbacterium immunditiarum]|uniref:Uncharacterized protein n=1 Tax=Microbacterium immunditiarum TaxID=337480 RepID=A0A7Y9GK26_9MICO|nr:hypothetical protein [Microbacterium immunditiarum]NYE17986.1 hypothetical protein [Microbacterium immunditiarum]